jgi:hypothetical protein
MDNLIEEKLRANLPPDLNVVQVSQRDLLGYTLNIDWICVLQRES